MIDTTSSVQRRDRAPSGEASPLRVFYGHHKCATAWIDGVLREVALHLGLQFKIVHRPRDYAEAGTLPALVARDQIDVLAYTNADYAVATTLPDHLGFHVVRDPRDVLVSAYFSHLHSHSTKNWPELERHRERLHEVSREDGLFLEMEFSRPVFEQMGAWDYAQPHVLEMRMEDLTAAPLDGFLSAFRWLGLVDEDADGMRGAVHRAVGRMNRLNHRGRRFMPGRLPLFPVPRHRLDQISRSEIERIVHERSFARLAGGRAKGAEDVKSHYRKGTPGDWQNHFVDAHRRAFKHNYNDVLVALGYETDATW